MMAFDGCILSATVVFNFRAAAIKRASRNTIKNPHPDYNIQHEADSYSSLLSAHLHLSSSSFVILEMKRIFPWKSFAICFFKKILFCWWIFIHLSSIAITYCTMKSIELSSSSFFIIVNITLPTHSFYFIFRHIERLTCHPEWAFSFFYFLCAITWHALIFICFSVY